MAVVALMIGGGILAGVPLLAGFGPRWQIIHTGAEVNPVLPALLVLGGLGVAIGYFRGLRAMIAPGHGPARVTFAEPRLLLALISLLIVVSILLGLFPALLIEPLQLLTMTVSVPIQ
jgi:formate hydrogenlyase subunit 3/multisubunit Na+/H+ antiporter MnhD subunit